MHDGRTQRAFAARRARAAPGRRSRSRSSRAGWTRRRGGRPRARLPSVDAPRPRASARRAVDGRGRRARRRPRDRRDARRRDRRGRAPPWPPALRAGRARGAPLRRVRARRARQAARARGPTSRSARCTRCSRCRRPRSASPGSRARGARSTARRRSSGSRCRSACGRSGSPTTDRAAYHAAATIASNHLVALLGQVERVADAAGVPPEALAPARPRDASTTSTTLGPAAALTGPVARGDVDTVAAPPRRAARRRAARRTARWPREALRARRSRRRRTCATLLADERARDHRHRPIAERARRVRRRARAAAARVGLRADDGLLPRRAPVADARARGPTTTSWS